MKALLSAANGFVVFFVGGYSVAHDWQAWALICWFGFAVIAVEELTRNEVASRINPLIGRMERTLGRRR